MRRVALVLTLCVAAIIGACSTAGPVTPSLSQAAQKDGDPVLITLQVQKHLDRYYQQVSGGRPGAFAVSQRGNVGFYAYCQAVSCRDDISFTGQALRGCEARGLGKCVLLAVGHSVQRPYMTYQEAEEKGLLKKATSS